MLESETFFSLAKAGSLPAFGYLAAFLIGGILFTAFSLSIARLIAPYRPNAEKLASYECGEDPVGDAGIQFHVRFYLVALVFLIFEVEILFLFPWATVFARTDWIAADPRWGWIALSEMVLFASILLLGLAYAWRRGDLDGAEPTPLIHKAEPIEGSVYEVVNQKYA